MACRRILVLLCSLGLVGTLGALPASARQGPSSRHHLQPAVSSGNLAFNLGFETTIHDNGCCLPSVGQWNGYGPGVSQIPTACIAGEALPGGSAKPERNPTWR